MGIAELRGSEDLWEVARLHDRESSFPMVPLSYNYTVNNFLIIYLTFI